MHLLTVCRAGNNRSVVLASILKMERGHNDVINYGREKVSPETEKMLCEWADKILVTTKEVDVPEEYRHKRIYLDVGVDRWGYAHNQELAELLREMLNMHDL